MSAKQPTERPRYTLSTIRLIQRGAGSQCDTVCANMDFYGTNKLAFVYGIILTLFIHVNSFFSSFLLTPARMGRLNIDYGTPVTNCGCNVSHFQCETELCRVGNCFYQILESIDPYPGHISLAFNPVTASFPAHAFRRVQVILSFFLLITSQLAP